MKILRGVGIFICILVITFIVLFNVNNVLYRTSNQHINFFGYKFMTIDNKYDYYLVKDVSVDDVILYDNVSFRVNSTDLSTDSVKGKVNDCLKLANDSTIVCSDNLEGKVVMKVSGARDLLLVNKGAIIVLIVCIILLVLVFLWKPKDLKRVKIDNKEKVNKEKKEESVVEISTEPFKEEEKKEMPINNDPTVIIDTSPFKEEIKTDVELPQNDEIQNNQVNEVNTFNVQNNLEMQNNIELPVENNAVENSVDIPPTNKFEMNVDTVPTESVSFVEEEHVPQDVIVVPLERPATEEEEDDSLNDVIKIPYDKVMELRKEQKEEQVQDYSEGVNVPLTYSSDRYDEYTEVIKVPVEKYKENKSDYFDSSITNDIFSDANINSSVEINLDDVEVDDTSDKIKVTPIYSSNQGFNEDIEIL